MKQTSNLQKPIIVGLLALLCTILWGSAFPSIKIGYQLFHISSSQTWSIILFAGLRFTLAGIITVLLGSISSKRLLLPSRPAIPKIVAICIFQTIVQYIFFYYGLAHTSGVKSSIINGSGTFFTILASCLIFKFEKMTPNKLIGCILGFIGIILVNLTPAGVDMNLSFYGEGCILISALSHAVSSSLLKYYSKSENPVMLSGYQFIFGGSFMIVLSLFMGGQIPVLTTGGIAILFYLAFVSGIAYSLWGILLKYNPVSQVTIYGFMNPVFGSLLSAIFLKEGSQLMGFQTLIALILVSMGIFFVNKAPSR